MDIKDLKLLIKLVTETDITEFEMDNSDEKIIIKRGHKPEYVTVAAPAAQQYAPSGYQPAPVFAPTAPATAPAVSAAEAGDTLNSPIVGTFYEAPGPDASPYVAVGQIVEKGQVLCIVEAMKLMNEIEAEVDGVVLRILVENNQPVEYGEPLFLVEPL